jgi:hypothetical protein
MTCSTSKFDRLFLHHDQEKQTYPSRSVWVQDSPYFTWIEEFVQKPAHHITLWNSCRRSPTRPLPSTKSNASFFPNTTTTSPVAGGQEYFMNLFPVLPQAFSQEIDIDSHIFCFGSKFFRTSSTRRDSWRTNTTHS